jgi:hypothetical protein
MAAVATIMEAFAYGAAEFERSCVPERLRDLEGARSR